MYALEKGMAAHCSVLAWRIPGTGEPGGLPAMGSHRVRHDRSDLTAAAAAHGQLCLTRCDPVGCSPPGSSVHGILQARTLQWAAIPFSRDRPDLGIKPGSSALLADSLPSEPPGELLQQLYSELSRGRSIRSHVDQTPNAGFDQRTQAVGAGSELADLNGCGGLREKGCLVASLALEWLEGGIEALGVREKTHG